MALSYQLNFGSNKLSLGAQGSFYSSRTDFSKLDYVSEEYRNLFEPITYDRLNKPNFGLGVMYAGRKFFGGVSVPRLFAISPGYTFKQDNTGNISNPIGSRYQPYVTASLGKIFHYKDKMEIKPSFMVKHVNKVGVLMDLNISMLYKHIIWTGLSLRNSIQRPDADASRLLYSFNTLALMAQAQLSDRFKAGFSYDIVLVSQALRSQRGYKAPFEIMVNYNLAIFEEQGVHTFLF